MMNIQQPSYEEQEQVEYVYGGVNQHGKSAVLVVTYFLMLAVLMIPASKFHLGMQGVFFAMVAAGAALGLGSLLFKLIRRKMEALRLSKKGFLQMMVGYMPEALDASVVADGVRATDQLSRTGERGLVVLLGGNNAPEELPDTIIEEDPVWLADTFRPNINSMLGAMHLLCGMRRSGKSNLLAVIAEEMGRYALPLVIFDTEDEYAGLVNKQYLPRGFHVGSADLQGESPVLANYVSLDVEGAYDFGKAVLDGHLQAVVNLKSWQDEDAAIVMTEIIDGLNDWQQERPNKDRIPVIVFLDEATKWLPQNLADSYVSKERQTDLHHAFFDIVVARGGKRGFGFVAACQRYSQINKNVLRSLWKFLFLQTEDADLSRYERLGLEREDVAALRQGECFVFSPSVIGFKAMMRERYSPHMGHTPGLDDLWRHTRHLAPVQSVLGRSFSAQLVQTAGERQPDHMEGLTPRPTRVDPAKQELERAVTAYNGGATSIDKLAVALGITAHAARQLKPKVEAEIKRRQTDEQPESE